MKSLLFLILFLLYLLPASAQYALRFDGANDWIAVNSPLSGDANYTIEAWFLSENTDNCGSGKYRRIIGWNGYKLELAVCGAGLRFYDGRAWKNTGQNIGDGQWHHVAVVRDKPNYKIYVDGQLALNYNRNNSINLAGAFSIGSTRRFGDKSVAEHFKGDIDEVRLWDLPRSQQDIQATRQQPLAGTETGLVGYWAFDEGPGSATTADLSNNNNAGTLMNFDVNTTWAGPGAPLQATGGATTFGYTALQPVLSGSLTYHSNGQLSFSYQERYAPSKLRCRVYGAGRSVLLQQELQVGLGWNYLDLDVSTLANGADDYVLEVWNARGEKGYLRFR